MPTRALYRGKVSNLAASENAAPIFVDSDASNAIKVNVGGPGSSTELVIPTAVGTATKVAGGTGTLDGSNPTAVATGLTTVTSFVVTLIATTVGAAPAALTLTHAAPVGGSVDVYAWAQDGTASTDTDTFSWIAVGS